MIKITLRAYHYELLLQKRMATILDVSFKSKGVTKKSEVEAMYVYIPVAVPHPGCADWNNTKNS